MVGMCGGQVVLGADSSSLATYDGIHISFGHISAQVHMRGVLGHLFICTFHFISFDTLGGLSVFRNICIDSIFGLQITY